MIEAIQVTSGFASELSALKGRGFEFNKGLSVLFGMNGCGKSTLLKILGAYTSTQGGWSKPHGFHENKEFPDCFAYDSPGESKAMVSWDGSPVFFHSAQGDCTPLAFGISDCFDDMEELQAVVSKPSSGQLRIWKLSKIFKIKPPDLSKDYNKTHKAFTKYVSSLSRTGPTTFLLDEPDRSLSIENQIDLWKLLPRLATKFQIIVATHSPFAIMKKQKDVTYIDLGEGYMEKCRTSIKEFMEETK